MGKPARAHRTRPLRAPPLLSCGRLVQRGRLWTWGCNQRGQLGLADGLYLGNIDYPNENTVGSGAAVCILKTWSCQAPAS